MARVGTPPTPARDKMVRLDQLVRVVEINCEKLADPELDLPIDHIDRLQAALKRAFEANTTRLLHKSVELRALAEVGQ